MIKLLGCFKNFNGKMHILLDISQNKLANTMSVPPRRINEIIHGNRAITADTDLRLSKALGTSEGFWLGLQMDFDLEERKKIIKPQLTAIVNLALKEQ